MQVEADLLNSVRFECLTNKTIDAAIEIFIDRMQFASHFSVHGSFDTTVQGLKEVKEFCHHVALDGYSIVAIDKNNDRVVGVIFNKLDIPLQNDFLNSYMNFIKTLKNEWLKCLMLSMIKQQINSNLFKRFKISCCLNMIATVTILEYEPSNLASLFVKATVHFCEQIRAKIKGLLGTSSNVAIPTNIAIFLPDMLSVLAVCVAAKQYFLRQNLLSMHSFSYKELGLNVPNTCQPLEGEYRKAYLMLRWVI